MMWVMISQLTSTKARYRFPLPAVIATRRTFAMSPNSPASGRKPSDPHHLRFLQPRALGRKASDEFSVPLCRIHHRLVHRVGNEAAWWKDAGIDPAKAARKLWNDSRIDQVEECVDAAGLSSRRFLFVPVEASGEPL